jgi:hypothetical protein
VHRSQATHGHGEVGVMTERHDAVHECMRREHRRNARARESMERWPNVREGLTYVVCVSMKRKQHGWVHGADKLRHEWACERGSRANAAPHGLVQVGHVCETRELGLTDRARLAVRYRGKVSWQDRRPANITARRAGARPGRPSGMDTRAQEPSECSDLSLDLVRSEGEG